MTTKGWLAWLGAGFAVVLTCTSPVVTLTAIACAALTGAACARRAPEGRSVWLFLKIGLAFCAMRVVLFGLTGHVGATTLVHLPSLTLPRWLGAFTLGGRITAEELAQQGAEGLRIAALLVVIGVFLSAVETSRVLRLVPRGLHQAGLVVSIALAFVPSMVRMVAEVRDAQRLRGERFRGLRSLRTLVGPVLAGALERSLDLAASMESRGYGRANRRTRVRPEPLSRADLVEIGISVATVGVAMLTRVHARWSAMPAIEVPPVDVLTVLPALSLCAPVVLVMNHRSRMRAASGPEPALTLGMMR